MTKLIRDTRLLLSMHLQDSRRNPGWFLVGIVQPVLWLLLFAPLLQPLMGGTGFDAESAINFFTPGMLVLLAVLSTLLVGLGIIGDRREGILEKLRVTPVSPLALPLSLLLRDGLLLFLQSGVLLLVALPLGLRPDLAGLVLMMALVILVGLFVSSVSYTLALLVNNEYALSSLANLLILPLILLSGVTLPLTLAPPLLQTIGRLNPFSHAVDASRALATGDLMHTAALTSFALFAVLFGLAFVFTVRAFRHSVH